MFCLNFWDCEREFIRNDSTISFNVIDNFPEVTKHPEMVVEINPSWIHRDYIAKTGFKNKILISWIVIFSNTNVVREIVHPYIRQ